MGPKQIFRHIDVVMYTILAFQLAGFILGCWVTYMFYGRLRDVAEELKKLRMAYEFAHDRQAQSISRQEARTTGAWPETPKLLVPSKEDERYMPKS